MERKAFHKHRSQDFNATTVGKVRHCRTQPNGNWIARYPFNKDGEECHKQTRSGESESWHMRAWAKSGYTPRGLCDNALVRSALRRFSRPLSRRFFFFKGSQKGF